MTIVALTLILVSSVIHAWWNLLAKRASGGLAFTWLFGLLSVIVYTPFAVAIYTVERPDINWMSVLFVIGSALLHLGYLSLLQRGYRVGDMSLVYPIARGSSPLLTLLVATAFLDERVTYLAGLGIALIVMSTVVFSGVGSKSDGVNKPEDNQANRQDDHEENVDKKRSKLAITYGILTGFFIASYTLWDKYAVSRLLIPPLLYDWSANFIRTAALSLILLRPQMRREITKGWTNTRKEAWGIAILSPLAYILVLTAMTFTPVSYVAPAREVSILIGTFLGARVLSEGHAKRRLIGALTMTSGVVLIALKG